jgi:hypothetical protein
MSELDDFTMAEIRKFIASVEWRYAKTMPSCPHFYNMLLWNSEKKDGFMKLVSAVFNHGYKEPWPRPPQKASRIVTYFNVDGFRYWVMDATIEETDLINRAEL